MTAAPDVAAAFRAARRRDWAFIGQAHLLALPLSILIFAGLCLSNGQGPFFAFPHYFYWTVVGGVFSAVWPYAYLGVVGMVVLPIWVYRWLCYLRHGGTSSLLAAGLRGRWTERPWYGRAGVALAMACLPTSWLVRRGAHHRSFEMTDAPVRRPNRALMMALVSLAISFHHLPFNYAVQAAFCVRAPWTITLPNWLGPCTASLGYAPGAKRFGCSERR